MHTVADAAQVYADFSKKEVRVPRSLLGQALSSANGQGKAAAGYLITILASKLSHDGVEIAPLGGAVVAFRPGQTFQGKMTAMKPVAASADELAAARAAMSNDRF